MGNEAATSQDTSTDSDTSLDTNSGEETLESGAEGADAGDEILDETESESDSATDDGTDESKTDDDEIDPQTWQEAKRSYVDAQVEARKQNQNQPKTQANDQKKGESKPDPDSFTGKITAISAALEEKLSEQGYEGIGGIIGKELEAILAPFAKELDDRRTTHKVRADSAKQQYDTWYNSQLDAVIGDNQTAIKALGKGQKINSEAREIIHDVALKMGNILRSKGKKVSDRALLKMAIEDTYGNKQAPGGQQLQRRAVPQRKPAQGVRPNGQKPMDDGKLSLAEAEAFKAKSKNW